MKSKAIDDDYFVRNAIFCWLHYSRDKWVDAYRELLKRESFNSPLPGAMPGMSLTLR